MLGSLFLLGDWRKGRLCLSSAATHFFPFLSLIKNHSTIPLISTKTLISYGYIIKGPDCYNIADLGGKEYDKM